MPIIETLDCGTLDAGLSFDWVSLIEIEPRLAELYEEVRKLKDPGGGYFCAETIWHRRIKPQLVALVGFRAHAPRLRSMAAYDLAFEKLYGAMPPCRGCACLSPLS